MKSKQCVRVRLTTETSRRLWSESGGYCQNPACARHLFADGSDIDFAEMAHILPASPGGPRDVPVLEAAERAHHTNIVLLCATCHTIVDRDPDRYPAARMTQWKERSRDLLERALGTPAFSSRREAREHFTSLLADNRLVHSRYAPKSDEFSDAAAEQWRRHLHATVLPNNRAILRVLEKNRRLLDARESATADIFALHVRELEFRHLLKDWTAGSTRFPEDLNSILDGER